MSGLHEPQSDGSWQPPGFWPELTLKAWFWEANAKAPEFVLISQFHIYVPFSMFSNLNRWTAGDCAAGLVSSFFHEPFVFVYREISFRSWPAAAQIKVAFSAVCPAGDVSVTERPDCVGCVVCPVAREIVVFS